MKKGRQKISNGILIPIREKDVQQGLHMSYGHTKPYFVLLWRNVSSTLSEHLSPYCETRVSSLRNLCFLPKKLLFLNQETFVPQARHFCSKRKKQNGTSRGVTKHRCLPPQPQGKA